MVNIAPKAVFSSKSAFVITESGRVLNGGKTFFYNNYHNQGIFTSYGKQAQSYFTRTDNILSEISGNAVSEFLNITWDNNTPDKAFDLKSNIEVYGRMVFKDGIVYVDNSKEHGSSLSKGMITVFNLSSAHGASDKSYVNGKMEKIGNKSYQFPVGNKGIYRPLTIAGSDCVDDGFVVEYFYQDKEFFKDKQKTVSVIQKINTSEFWQVEKSQNTKSPIILSLSIDSRTIDDLSFEQDYQDIHIIVWNERLGIWQDEGGVIDKGRKTVTAPVNLRPTTSFFTLGRVIKDKHLPADVLVYNFVSANDDGKNDYLYIQNLHKYPGNSVEIYNRWGTKVFSTTNYDTYSDGTNNVFKGYAKSGLVVKQGNKLPSGTYYYIIRYPFQDKNGQRIISKSGSLHLESD
ncbi:gliding motility-associated C-terminal domain-containing protein [Myroides sp. LJL119]